MRCILCWHIVQFVTVTCVFPDLTRLWHLDNMVWFPAGVLWSAHVHIMHKGIEVLQHIKINATFEAANADNNWVRRGQTRHIVSVMVF